MIELLRTRRSIRQYTGEPIEPRKIEILKEALLRAPSSKNINHCEFIFVQQEDTLRQLSFSKEHGSAFIANAALGIVICGNQRKSDVWIEDCAVAAIIVQLTAHSLGLGSCWLQIRNRRHSDEISSEEFIRKRLHIPAHIRIDSIISIGYPAEEKKILPMQKLDLTRIKIETYARSD